MGFPDSINSDKSLRVAMNVPTFNLRYPTNFINGIPEVAYPFEWYENTVMITDAACQRAELTGNENNPMEAVQRYELFRESLAENCPNLRPNWQIGTYISGSNTEPYRNNSTYPQRALRQDLFTEDELWPEGTYGIPSPIRILKYSNHEASLKFAKYLALEIKRRGLKHVFLDNFAVTQATGSLEKLEDVIIHLNNVADALHAYGISCIGNIAGEPSLGVPDDEWDKYCNCKVDGFSWEMACTIQMRNDPELIKLDLKRWASLKSKKCVILIPSEASYGKPFTNPPDNDTYGNFAQFLAGVCMLLRWPRNKIFVSWPMWRENMEWELWPEMFEKAIGDYYQDSVNPLLFHRKFGAGKLSVGFGDEPFAQFAWNT